MEAEELILSVQKKMIPSVGKSTRAELALQEVDIVSSLRACDSLQKIGELIDKLVVYVAMSKHLEV